MYSIENSISHWDLIMSCIVMGVYISGKLWLYYNHTKDTTKPKKGGVIRRGPEWD